MTFKIQFLLKIARVLTFTISTSPSSRSGRKMTLLTVFLMLIILTALPVLVFPFSQQEDHGHRRITFTDSLIRFDGVGAISGGGATSKLLHTYKYSVRKQIFDLLFKPQYGASLHILKVEIGGDGQSTEGTESSHMHTPADESYLRGYEWEVMKEAKRRNPDILLIGLAWAFPGWISNGTQDPFRYPKLTTEYLVRWVKGAKTYHNLTIDYLGIWNEPNFASFFPGIATLTKILRTRLNSEGLGHIKLIVGEQRGWDIAETLLEDAKFRSAVDILSTHYAGEVSTTQALQTGKTLWASEDYSTIDDTHGAACLARIINRNFVNGQMTSTIAWNLVASYYATLPYPKSSLFTADEPWSGHYSLNPPMWVMAHTAQFTQPGWSYVTSACYNLTLGGTMVTLTNPQQTELTIVIETMSFKFSKCIRPKTPQYVVLTQNITIELDAKLRKTFHNLMRWTSYLDKFKPQMMQRGDDVTFQDGRLILVDVEPNTLITLSTITGLKGDPGPIAKSKPFPLNYRDPFDGYDQFMEPAYLTPQIGSFEVRTLSSGNKVLLQTVRQMPVEFCAPTKGKNFRPRYIPIALMLNQIYSYNQIYPYSRWMAINVLASISVRRDQMPAGLFLALDVQQGGCKITDTQGLYFVANATLNGGACAVYNRLNFTDEAKINQSKCLFDAAKPYATDLPRQIDANKEVYNPFERMNRQGLLISKPVWHLLTIKTNGNQFLWYIDRELVMNVSRKWHWPNSGFIGLGCTGFYECIYDDLEIHPISNPAIVG